VAPRATTTREPAADGRQRRAERSREGIVRALYELVGAGVLRPTAQQVAQRAGVGIRTVFRHFSDVESLFAEMNARLQAEVLPLLLAGEPSGSRTARTSALVERRVRFFERIAPYKRAGNLQRPRSPFLRRQHRALVRELRSDLLRWLPELRGGADERVEALDLVLSFEAWDRLRGEQRLSRERARAALLRAVRALAADAAA
jgi:AcrR family transcriptional regulator